MDKKHRSGRGEGFQDHGSEGVQTMVPDHGFARLGTMQVQATMPPLIKGDFACSLQKHFVNIFFRVCQGILH